MNSILLFNRAVRHFSRKFVVLGIVLASGLVTVNASAQVVTINPTLQATNTSSFASQLAKTVQQYAQQIKQYVLQIEQYKQLLFTAMNLGTNFSITPTTMQPIGNPGALIETKCGSGSSGGLASSVVSNLASLVHQPVSQSQHAICASIVTLQVDKYNKTVKALGSIEGYGNSLTNISNFVNEVENVGSSSEATSLVSAYSSQLQTEASDWQASLKADDAAITALQGQQAILTRMALDGGGSSNILTQALPDVAFEAAVHSIQ